MDNSLIIAMPELTNYRIVVKTLQGEVIGFYVDNYVIVEGNFVSFFHEKSGEWKRFHSSNCEIYNEGEDDGEKTNEN